METLKTAILELVTKRDHVSFGELINEFGSGGQAIYDPSYENIILGVGINDETANALLELMHEKKVFLHPAHPMVYMCDGGMPSMPWVKSMRHYKKPHWLPTVIRTVPYKPAKSKAKVQTVK